MWALYRSAGVRLLRRCVLVVPPCMKSRQKTCIRLGQKFMSLASSSLFICIQYSGLGRKQSLLVNSANTNNGLTSSEVSFLQEHPDLLLDTPGLTSLADFSLEPALTTLSGTNADFSLEPALSPCQPCSQALQL